MSEETGGPAIEPIDGRTDDVVGGGTLDGVHRTLSTLGMRIDALVTSTTSYRSAVTDRLTEYADLVTKLTRAQAADLEEYRHATERTMGELRRGVGASEETLERVASRIDAMLSDADVSEDQSRRVLGEVRSILDAQESLGRFLTEALDQFGNQVTERLNETQSAHSAQLDALLGTLTAADGTNEIQTLLDQVNERLLDTASGEVVGALWDEVRALRTAVESGPAGDLGDRVSALTDAVGSLLDSAEMVDEAEINVASQGAIEQIAAEMGRLRNDLSEGLVIDADGAMGDAGIDEVRTDIARLTDQVESLAASWSTTTAQLLAVESATPVDDELRAEVTALTAQVAELGSGVTAIGAGVLEIGSGVQRMIAAEAEVPTEPAEPAADELRADVATLAAEVRQLLVHAEVVDDDQFDVVGGIAPEAIGHLADQLAEVRAQLDSLSTRTGPSPARIDAAITSLQASLDALRAETGSVGISVGEVLSRLDEGLELADDVGPVTAPLDAGLGDRIASMRDEVAAEFDALRQLVAAAGRAPAEAAPAPTVDLDGVTDLLALLRDDIAELPHRVEASFPAPVAPVAPAPPPPPAAPTFATVDPDTIDVLRAEIRAAGAVPDELAESLRNELRALRRRIKLRAEGEVLSDEQLTLIAEAVAARLDR